MLLFAHYGTRISGRLWRAVFGVQHERSNYTNEMKHSHRTTRNSWLMLRVHKLQHITWWNSVYITSRSFLSKHIHTHSLFRSSELSKPYASKPNRILITNPFLCKEYCLTYICICFAKCLCCWNLLHPLPTSSIFLMYQQIVVWKSSRQRMNGNCGVVPIQNSWICIQIYAGIIISHSWLCGVCVLFHATLRF